MLAAALLVIAFGQVSPIDSIRVGQQVVLDNPFPGSKEVLGLPPGDGLGAVSVPLGTKGTVKAIKNETMVGTLAGKQFLVGVQGGKDGWFPYFSVRPSTNRTNRSVGEVRNTANWLG